MLRHLNLINSRIQSENTVSTYKVAGSIRFYISCIEMRAFWLTNTVSLEESFKAKKTYIGQHDHFWFLERRWEGENRETGCHLITYMVAAVEPLPRWSLWCSSSGWLGPEIGFLPVVRETGNTYMHPIATWIIL